ncbi:iron-sulfur cluster biosynthesis family protein [Nitrospira sp. M1]
MVKVTQSAIAKLKALVVEHPEDPIVRIKVHDQDDQKITFSITLEDKVQPDDDVQEIDQLMIAVEANSAPRMKGVVLDFQESQGFSFEHPETPGHHDEFPLNLINLN